MASPENPSLDELKTVLAHNHKDDWSLSSWSNWPSSVHRLMVLREAQVNRASAVHAGLPTLLQTPEAQSRLLDQAHPQYSPDERERMLRATKLRREILLKSLSDEILAPRYTIIIPDTSFDLLGQQIEDPELIRKQASSVLDAVNGGLDLRVAPWSRVDLALGDARAAVAFLDTRSGKGVYEESGPWVAGVRGRPREVWDRETDSLDRAVFTHYELGHRTLPYNDMLAWLGNVAGPESPK